MLTPSLPLGLTSIDSQWVTQPQVLHLMVLIVLAPQTYSVVLSGWPVIRTIEASYTAHNAPFRRQMEQLQSMSQRGGSVTSMRTAPQ
jgi:hypothetical protein